MTPQPPSTRRDPRYAPSPGAATVEFVQADGASTRWSCDVTRISICGIAFTIESDVVGLEPGVTIEGASLRVGDCKIDGDLTIRNAHPAGESSIEYGCLFYPASDEAERMMMALVAGIASAQHA